MYFTGRSYNTEKGLEQLSERNLSMIKLIENNSTNCLGLSVENSIICDPKLHTFQLVD